MRRHLLAIAAAISLAGCSNEGTSPAQAEEKPTTPSGIFSAMPADKVFQGAEATAAKLAKLNPAFALAGLKELAPAAEDACFLGFLQKKPDGEFASYSLDPRITGGGAVSFVLEVKGRCSYDAAKRLELCTPERGQESYIKYPNPNSFADMVVFNSARDAEHNEDGLPLSPISCTGIADQLLARVDANAKDARGAYFQDYPGELAAVIRASLDNLKYFQVFKSLQPRP